MNLPFGASIVLFTTLSLAGTGVAVVRPLHSDPALVAPAAAELTGAAAPATLSADDRAALRSAELASGDLEDVTAGFAMDNDDLVLVLGTVAVVVLIALLL